MKWILVFLAVWNVAGALLRICRILFERLPILGRLYPDRDSRPLDEISETEICATAKARYRAAAENLSRQVGIPVPELRCSPKSALIAGTRGWNRHQMHLSRGILNRLGDRELLAIVAHELGHVYYRHYAALRIAELVAAFAYARVVLVLWDKTLAWYTLLGLWSLLDFSFSLFRLAAGSATELMADHFAAHRLNLAEELSHGLQRAQCFNGATEFVQITNFYPTVKLRTRLLSRYARSLGEAKLV